MCWQPWRGANGVTWKVKDAYCLTLAEDQSADLASDEQPLQTKEPAPVRIQALRWSSVGPGLARTLHLREAVYH